MNRILKSFIDREPDYMVKDITDKDQVKMIPNKPGSYVFITTSKKMEYPNGQSQVVYIGMSTNLKRRIKAHLRALKDLDTNQHARAATGYYSRYQYLKSFGCIIFCYTTRGVQSTKKSESWLLDYFYYRYLALPVGNGANSY